jgi:hypothetical protein
MIASCVDSLNLQNDRNGSKSDIDSITIRPLRWQGL